MFLITPQWSYSGMTVKSIGYHFTGVRRAHNYGRVFPSIARPVDLTCEQCAVSHFHGYSLVDYHDWATRATQSIGFRRSSFSCIFIVFLSGKSGAVSTAGEGCCLLGQLIKRFALSLFLDEQEGCQGADNSRDDVEQE
jgi:hypothetical protein